MNLKKQFMEGLLTQNPVLVQVLGMCSTMAITTSFFNGLGMGVGYILTMTLMGSIREIIGSGTWMGIHLIPEIIDRMSIMNSAPGGFFVFGCLMAGCVWVERKLNKPIERKSCGDVMLEQIESSKAETEGGGEA